MINFYDSPELYLLQYEFTEAIEAEMFVLYWFQSEILNGGLLQFFENSTGVIAPEVVKALSSIGLNELSNKLNLHINTVSRYLNLLEKVFVIFRLSGFSRNLRKEVGKSFQKKLPRLRIVHDSEVLLGRATQKDLFRRPYWSNCKSMVKKTRLVRLVTL